MTKLRRGVDSLLATMDLHVIERPDLLYRIDDALHVVEQLKGQMQTLEAELQRQELDVRRVRGPVHVIWSILATTKSATVESPGAPGTDSDDPDRAEPNAIVIAQATPDGDAFRAVLAACKMTEQLVAAVKHAAEEPVGS